MKRPPQPSGEALTSTQVIRRVVTHPTQVVETLRRRPERTAWAPTRGLRIRLRVGSAVGALFGVLVGVLGLSAGSVVAVLGGVVLLTGSLSLGSLVTLWSPEVRSWDERLWDVAVRWANR